MEFSSSPEQERIREAIAKLCERFGDDYWLKKDREGGFPEDFHQALARDGWLDRKSTRLNSSHSRASRMPSSA